MQNPPPSNTIRTTAVAIFHPHNITSIILFSYLLWILKQKMSAEDDIQMIKMASAARRATTFIISGKFASHQAATQFFKRTQDVSISALTLFCVLLGGVMLGGLFAALFTALRAPQITILLWSFMPTIFLFAIIFRLTITKNTKKIYPRLLILLENARQHRPATRKRAMSWNNRHSDAVDSF
jgi:hypothetical protein